MLFDMLFSKPKQPKPDIRVLYDAINKIVRILDAATMPQHLDAAEAMLNALTIQWNLSPPGTSNPICVAIYETLCSKRADFIATDLSSIATK